MGNESVGNGGRGGVVIHGDNSGVVSVGDRNVNVQSKPSGSASPKASVAASGQAPAELDRPDAGHPRGN